jgi:hypothetical protein
VEVLVPFQLLEEVLEVVLVDFVKVKLRVILIQLLL